MRVTWSDSFGDKETGEEVSTPSVREFVVVVWVALVTVRVGVVPGSNRVPVPSDNGIPVTLVVLSVNWNGLMRANNGWDRTRSGRDEGCLIGV